MIKGRLGKALGAVKSISPGADRLKRFRAVVLVFVCWTIVAPGTGFTQQLTVNNNETVTAQTGATTVFSAIVVGSTSGTVGGVPGGTYIVPTGAAVELTGPNFIIGQQVGSSGLVTVNGGSITALPSSNSEFHIGFNGSGELVVSNGGTVSSAFLTFVGTNAGSSGVLTVEGQGSTYTNNGSMMVVGNSGTGQLNVLNGGAVSTTAATLQIGGSTGATGTAFVSGAGSLVSAATFLGVGVNAGSVGGLTIADGGVATSGSGTYLALNSGSVGTISVSNGGTLTSPLLVVGSSGTGNLQVQSNGTVTISGITIVGSNAGTSSVEVGGAGAAFTVQNSNLIVGGQGNGIMTISNQGTVSVTGSGGTSIAGQCLGLASFFCATPGQGGAGAVTVTDPGSVLNAGTALTIGQFGPGTLTIANGAQVFADSVVIAQIAGSAGTLNIGAAAGNAPVAPGTLNTPTMTFGAGTGNIVFNHTDTSGSYVFAPAISGTGAVEVFNGNTVVTGSSDYFGPTTIHGGILSAGAANVFSPNSDYAVQSGGTLNLNGFNQTVASVSNAGLINMGNGTLPGTLLTTNYVGQGGTLHLNAFLGADGSPSDKLVINGGSATGHSFVRITNAGGPGAETTANGILVVDAINGATTAAGAFALAGEARAGAFDYRLFQGGLTGSDPADWFLRSTFTNGPGPEEPIGPEPPPEPLPPGVHPIIGPELATYGVVQPIARQMGLTTLGTLHERVGDAAADAACLSADSTGSAAALDSAAITKAAPFPYDNCRPAVWGRLFGQQIDNHYEAFADPRTTGQVAGVQTGIDVWRGSLIPGHSDTAGLYFAYGKGHVGVDGLVTNAAATAYVLQHTGSVNLNAYSLGGYWTHYGPGGWYIDAVLQGSFYNGDASTQFASLPINGTGFTSSLEAGYPIPLSWFGPRFVLEPEGQIIWQRVSFRDGNDGLGPVGLGTTSGASGRLGLRGKWTVNDRDGRVWQPYVLANVWRDWGANANTMFGPDPVPLLEQATRLEFAGGLSAKILPALRLYAQAGYQLAVSSTDGGRRDGIKGDFGVRYSW